MAVGAPDGESVLLSSVFAAIRRHRMMAPGHRVLCACSGGPDSTALLDALYRLHARLGLKLIVAAVNHGLRPEAAAECEQVRIFAEERGLPFHLLQAELERPTQEAARRARMSLLEQCAAEQQCQRIALGHTRDDQAETVLMRILRGSGARGLAAIPPVRLPFVRPLLDVSREEVLNYLRERRLPFLHDPSNWNPNYLRVRVRHDLLPRLRRENPRIDEALSRMAANIRTERNDIVTPPLRHAHLRALADLLQTPGGTRQLDLGNGRIVEIRVLQGGRTRPARAAPVAAEIAIPGPGRYEIPSLGKALVVAMGATTAGPPPEGTPHARAQFEPQQLTFPLSARTRRNGDRIRLEVGLRKVSDVLIDAKVARSERDRLLLLSTSDNDVVWIEGIRQAAGSRPHGSECITVRIEPIA